MEPKTLKPCRKCGKAPELCGYTEKRIAISDWICVGCVRIRAEAVALAKKARKGQSVHTTVGVIQDGIETTVHRITTVNEAREALVLPVETEYEQDVRRHTPASQLIALPGFEEAHGLRPETLICGGVIDEAQQEAKDIEAYVADEELLAKPARKKRVRDAEAEKARHKAYRARKKTEAEAAK